MTDQAQAAAPPRTKPCDGCGIRVTLQERRADTGLCHPCNKAAVDYFDVLPEQAGTTVLCKKIAEHFSTGDENWNSLPIRYRVRCLVLASLGSIPNPAMAERAIAATLRERYAFLGRNPAPNKPESQNDFLEGMP